MAELKAIVAPLLQRLPGTEEQKLAIAVGGAAFSVATLCCACGTGSRTTAVPTAAPAMAAVSAGVAAGGRGVGEIAKLEAQVGSPVMLEEREGQAIDQAVGVNVPPTEQLVCQLRSCLRNTSETRAGGSVSPRNPFYPTLVDMIGGQGIWWTASGPCTEKDVREVVHASTSAGRNIYINTGGHGTADGTDPTRRGYGEYKFTDQDIDTIRKAPGPGKCSIHIVSKLSGPRYPDDRIDIIDAWCYSGAGGAQTYHPNCSVFGSFSLSSQPEPEPESGCGTDDDLDICLTPDQDDSDDSEDSDESCTERGIAAGRGNWWENGSIIGVYFLGPKDGMDHRGRKYPQSAEKLKKLVLKTANEWSMHCSISFARVRSLHDADITVSFVKSRAASSSVGTWGRTLSRKLARGKGKKPSMHLGPVIKAYEHNDEQKLVRTVRHEFGHALGLKHEHLHPRRPAYDKQMVYRHYRPWSNKKIDKQVLNKISCSNHHSQYDRHSVMHYPVPAELLVNKSLAVPWNIKLSKGDKKFIGTMYPKPAAWIKVGAIVKCGDRVGVVQRGPDTTAGPRWGYIEVCWVPDGCGEVNAAPRPWEDKVTKASIADQRSAAGWCKQGVGGKYEDRIGTLTMSPNSHAEVKLQWPNGSESCFVEAVRVHPISRAEREQLSMEIEKQQVAQAERDWDDAKTVLCRGGGRTTGMWYRCRNGHPFLVRNDGSPKGGKCGCGAEIPDLSIHSVSLMELRQRGLEPVDLRTADRELQQIIASMGGYTIPVNVDDD